MHAHYISYTIFNTNSMMISTNYFTSVTKKKELHSLTACFCRKWGHHYHLLVSFMAEITLSIFDSFFHLFFFFFLFLNFSLSMRRSEFVAKEVKQTLPWRCFETSLRTWDHFYWWKLSYFKEKKHAFTMIFTTANTIIIYHKTRSNCYRKNMS